MRRQLLALFGSMMITWSSFAQVNYVHQVIYLNEGQYDYLTQVQLTPVTLGSYDVIAETYTEFEQIEGARFGTDVLIDGD